MSREDAVADLVHKRSSRSVVLVLTSVVTRIAMYVALIVMFLMFPQSKSLPQGTASRTLDAGQFRLFQFGNRWGYQDHLKRERISPIFEEAQPFLNDRAIVKRSGSWGSIDITGRFSASGLPEDLARKFQVPITKIGPGWRAIDSTGQLVGPVYSELNSLGGGSWGKLSGDQSGWAWINPRTLQPNLGFAISQMREASSTRVWVQSDGRWILFDGQKGWSIATDFKDVTAFQDGAATVLRNGKWGIINESGLELTPFQYQDAGPMAESVAAVRSNTDWIYVDKHGVSVFLGQKFGRAFPFQGGRAVVVKNDGTNGWGTIDKYGVFRPTKMFQNSQSGLALSTSFVGGKWVVVDEKGKPVGPGYDDVRIASGGNWGKVGGKSGSWSWIDPKSLTPNKGFAIDSIVEASSDRVWALSDGKWQLLDGVGGWTVGTNWNEVTDFHEGIAAVQRDGKWGFISESGMEVSKYDYDFAGPMSEGLSPVKIGDKWGYVDKHGEMRIKPQFELAFPFSDGTAEVTLDGKPFLVRPDGQMSAPPSITPRTKLLATFWSQPDKAEVWLVDESAWAPFSKQGRDLWGAIKACRSATESDLAVCKCFEDVGPSIRHKVPVRQDAFNVLFVNGTKIESRHHVFMPGRTELRIVFTK